MMWSMGFVRAALLLLGGMLVGGCLPAAPGDEEREPYFLAGKGRVSSMDYTGAIQSFEKALDVNPKSAAAHFELGCLYDQKVSDPAAAIYHYERYLKLTPNSGKDERVEPRILACKQQLAQSVSLAPFTEKQQHQLEELALDNKRLREEIERWRAYALCLQALTNKSSAPAPVARANQPSPPGQAPLTNTISPSRPAVSPANTSRTHVVKEGDRLSAIARMYGIKLEALKAANPKLDPRRLRVGQSLIIPTP